MSRLGRAQGKSAALMLTMLAAWVLPQGSHAQGASELGAPVQAEAEAEAIPAEAEAHEHVAVLAPVLQGVDAVIGPHVVHGTAQAISSLGYASLDETRVQQAAEQVGLQGYPAPADLWRMVYASGAQAGLAARVWAERGMYVIEVQAALRDGRGPYVQRHRTDHTQFLSTLEALVRVVLPPPGGEVAEAPDTLPFEAPNGDAFEPPADAAPEERDEAPLKRIGLAASTESVVGLSGGGFYNHLLGARLDIRLTREIALGAYAGYANLDGSQGRAHNLLSYLQLEDRVRVSRRSKLRLPLRFGAGFLPRNGAMIRVAAGLAYPLSESVELGADLLTPTVWILPEGEIATSLNFALEVIYSP